MIIDTLNALCSRLSAAPLPMHTLAAQLGTITAEHKYNLAVAPSDAVFVAIHVVRGFDVDEVTHLDLVLREPLSLNLLVTAFGDYHITPAMPHEPKEAVFYVSTHSIALLASLDGDQVQSITLRRD